MGEGDHVLPCLQSANREHGSGGFDSAGIGKSVGCLLIGNGGIG